MTPTMQLVSASPAIEEIKAELRRSLNHPDNSGYDFMPPVTVIQQIAMYWSSVAHIMAEDFVAFVSMLVEGVGWVVDEEATVHLGGSNARIVLLRDL